MRLTQEEREWLIEQLVESKDAALVAAVKRFKTAFGAKVKGRRAYTKSTPGAGKRALGVYKKSLYTKPK